MRIVISEKGAIEIHSLSKDKKLHRTKSTYNHTSNNSTILNKSCSTKQKISPSSRETPIISTVNPLTYRAIELKPISKIIIRPPSIKNSMTNLSSLTERITKRKSSSTTVPTLNNNKFSSDDVINSKDSSNLPSFSQMNSAINNEDKIFYKKINIKNRKLRIPYRQRVLYDFKNDMSENKIITNLPDLTSFNNNRSSMKGSESLESLRLPRDHYTLDEIVKPKIFDDAKNEIGNDEKYFYRKSILSSNHFRKNERFNVLRKNLDINKKMCIDTKNRDLIQMLCNRQNMSYNFIEYLGGLNDKRIEKLNKICNHLSTDEIKKYNCIRFHQKLMERINNDKMDMFTPLKLAKVNIDEFKNKLNEIDEKKKLNWKDNNIVKIEPIKEEGFS